MKYKKFDKSLIIIYYNCFKEEFEIITFVYLARVDIHLNIRIAEICIPDL